ncbi:MAG: GIY-YIG nuclease family protein [Verrucomicrobia bacterium]|nr:GIY-YIG nuclease family protein [Verrucomicrobiota bacterium]MDA1088388.1 GIY-YIG nuclease family protein [Verrucomicrobiota bacterium]
MKYYVYILRSRKNPAKTYIGISDDVPTRVKKHNDSGTKYTATHRSWELVAIVGVPSKSHAARLEKYFKTGSSQGR